MTAKISRIVPKNLLASAMHAVGEENYSGDPISLSNIRDLATLVNLAVLYDEIETIGNMDELNRSYKPHLAEGYQAIQNVGLRVVIGPKEQDLGHVLSAAAGFAAEPITAAGSDVMLDALKQRLSSSFRGAMSAGPDYWSDFEEGRRLFLARNLDRDSPAEDFWLRSFLYLGLAKIREMPFVADSVRSWGLSVPCPCPDYQKQLETIIEAKYTPEQISKLIPDIPVPLPPLAAAVFLRAGTRRNIMSEMKALREELTPVRTALAAFQHKRQGGEFLGYLTIFGGYYSSTAQREADENVHDALEVLRKLKLPLPPQLLAVKPASEITKSIASLLTTLLSAVSHPVKAAWEAYTLFSQANAVSSWSEKNAFVEVHHRLGWTLRTWFPHQAKIQSLFGAVVDDEPRQS
jgi:hypothetical protein